MNTGILGINVGSKVPDTFAIAWKQKSLSVDLSPYASIHTMDLNSSHGQEEDVTKTDEEVINCESNLGPMFRVKSQREDNGI